MIISLIGYRGCGKSSLAPLLAEPRQWPFIDADRELEKRAGQSIAEIFAQHGEAGFREREAALLQELYRRENLVIATGGGAILNPQTRQQMRASGPVIWLQADVDTLLERTGQDPSTASSRPALTQLSPREEVEKVLAFRAPLYLEVSHFQVATSGQTLVEITEQIETFLQNLPENLTQSWSCRA